jgi:hypothetical protein
VTDRVLTVLSLVMVAVALAVLRDWAMATFWLVVGLSAREGVE